MRRTLLGLAIVPAILAAIVASPVPASAGARTFVTYDCSHVKIEPRQILFACGDGAFYSDHLHWRKWHRQRAVGAGQFHQNDCRPDCAEGTFHERDGKIVLHGKKWCADVEKYVFAHARIHYERPLLGNRRVHFGLACPMR